MLSWMFFRTTHSTLHLDLLSAKVKDHMLNHAFHVFISVNSPLQTGILFLYKLFSIIETRDTVLLQKQFPTTFVIINA